jgi:uncharacterized protein
MKLLFFSDIHGDLKALNTLMQTPADHYLCAGDLTNFSRNIDACGEILQQHGERVHVIPGNHETADQITAFAKKFGLHDFHSQSFPLGRHHVVGLGYSSPTPFDTPGEYSEEEIARRLSAFNGLKPMIAVIHCPPFRTLLDQMRAFRHGGSTAVREFIEREQPEHLFCGHIHEAAGMFAMLGRTRGMNVGKRGYLLDLNPELVSIQPS